MKCYKLTDADGYTRRGYYNETLWGEGITHTAMGNRGLCSSGVIHAYESPELALFLNPIHANIKKPLLWECEGEILVEDDGTKQGYRTLTTIKRIEYTKPSRNQSIRFGILCAKQVFSDSTWNEWADKWLDGTDRTANAAHVAYCADSACATYVAYAAYDAANAACYAAVCYAAARAAYCAYADSACANKNIDFAAIAKHAMEADDER
jgi:hypothetical protein